MRLRKIPMVASNTNSLVGYIKESLLTLNNPNPDKPEMTNDE